MGDKDLPLLCNLDVWRARHYLIKLSTDIICKYFKGELIVFFTKPTESELSELGLNCGQKLLNPEAQSQEVKTDSLKLILECNDICIESIYEICTPYPVKENEECRNRSFEFWSHLSKKQLEFEQDKYSISIKCFNKINVIIIINYCTKAFGNSISWKTDDDGNLCCFTTGSSINNRSLLPYQDRPFAMARWQAWITVPDLYYVSLTGDSSPIMTRNSSNLICFYYSTSMIIPLSTIAIAIGQWEPMHSILEISTAQQNHVCRHHDYLCQYQKLKNCSKSQIQISFLCINSIKTKILHLIKCTENCLKALCSILGPYPFERLEFVILPRSFSSLGFASPNLIFISKTLIHNDSSSHIRIAHEISHNWFGITIGAKDWREEWLSEGFATYIEDIIYVISVEISKMFGNEQLNFDKILKMNEEFFQLRANIRYKIMLAELENSDEDLQVLSPKPVMPNTIGKDQFGKQVIQNGCNVEKLFLQIHYLKGYFLLRYLSYLVGDKIFLDFLNKFVTIFHGCLISSKELVDFFFEYFPLIKSKVTEDEIYSEWLNTNKINNNISVLFEKLSDKNQLGIVANNHFQYWQCLCTTKNTGNVTRLDLVSKFQLKFSDQLVLILEWLLELAKVNKSVLTQVRNLYQMPSCCSDVRHRWCELVIKHNYCDLEEVQRFLIEDQSMGVYLYGELIISGKPKHINLARSTYHLLKDELDFNAKNVISSMLFGD